MASKRNSSADFVVEVGYNTRRIRSCRVLTLKELGCDKGLDKAKMRRINLHCNISLLALIGVYSYR